MTYLDSNNNKIVEYNENENGNCHGLYQKWYSNGKKWVEAYYIDGVENGISSQWHENGVKSIEYTMINDLANGNLFMWHENGNSLVKAYYVGGCPEGVFNTFYQNGNKQTEQFFLNGICQYIQCFDEYGNNISETDFWRINNCGPIGADYIELYF